MKLKYIFGMVAAVTDKKPIDSFTDESYWTKVSDLKYYANGLYDNLDKPGVDKDNTSDNCVTTNYSSTLFNEIVIPTTADNASADTYW